jgi:hypothetical protein
MDKPAEALLQIVAEALKEDYGLSVEKMQDGSLKVSIPSEG